MTFLIAISPSLVFSKADDGRIKEDTPGLHSFSLPPSSWSVPARLGPAQLPYLHFHRTMQFSLIAIVTGLFFIYLCDFFLFPSGPKLCEGRNNLSLIAST